jgi:hypothetical protein
VVGREQKPVERVDPVGRVRRVSVVDEDAGRDELDDGLAGHQRLEVTQLDRVAEQQQPSERGNAVAPGEQMPLCGFRARQSRPTAEPLLQGRVRVARAGARFM